MKTMRKQGLRWVAAAFVACLVAAPAHALQVFVDNFANDVVYDADTVPGIWQIRKGSYGRTSFVRASEANGFLTIETNDRYGGGVSTYNSPDFDFFARPLKFTIDGLTLSGTGHPSYQGVRIGLTPNGSNPFQRVNQLELAFNGNRHFTLMAFRNAQLNYLVNLDYNLPVIPERIELVLDATRYEVRFFWAGGGLFFQGEHGFTYDTWVVPGAAPTGETALFVAGASVVPTANTTTVQVDAIQVDEVIVNPSGNGLCQ